METRFLTYLCLPILKRVYSERNDFFPKRGANSFLLVSTSFQKLVWVHFWQGILSFNDVSKVFNYETHINVTLIFYIILQSI